MSIVRTRPPDRVALAPSCAVACAVAFAVAFAVTRPAWAAPLAERVVEEAASRTTGQADARAVTRAADVDFTACSIGDGRARVAAECGTVAVALDPTRPAGETLALAVARIPARRQVPDVAPFTLIAGGPGQSAIDSWPGVAYAFRHIARDRDIVLVDQRGTGASSRLDCDREAVDRPGESAANGDDAAGDAAGDATDVTVDDRDIPPPGGLDAAIDADPTETRARSRACLARLPLDPRLFTTSVAVSDLETVRERLGIERWNLYGVSYGTRVAQHYARRYPERVRTMIVDAAVPADVPLGPDIAPFADRALALVFARCAADPGCAGRFPDIEARTRAWLAALENAPLSLEHEDLASGERRERRFGARHLAALLRLMTYSAQTAALLPSMLDAAIGDGHVAPLARQAALQGEALGESLASGMHHAVVCTEDVPRLARDAADASAGTYLGTALIESLRASCADWPTGVLDADFFEPLTGEVPTLILSGEADPITPPVYGERLARTLGRARHLVNAGQGHMQAPLGCVPVIMARFVSTGDPGVTSRRTDAPGTASEERGDGDGRGDDPLDTACLERLTPPPFFVDANGPLP